MASSLSQQQPQMTTIMVPQPVEIRRGSPYMRRGAVLPIGCTCGTCSLILIPMFGITLLYMGIPLCFIHPLTLLPGVIITIIGALLTVGGFYLCCLAKRQFNALPPDHPERIKHSSGVAVPIRGRHAYTTYDVPVGTQVVPNAMQVGPTGSQFLPYAVQPGSNPVQVTGQAYLPVSTSGRMGGYPIGQVGNYAIPPEGQAQGYSASAPTIEQNKEDLPPSYMEICQKSPLRVK